MDPDRQRLTGFLRHLVGYFAAMVILVPLNLWLTPERIWFVYPMVGWGAILAIHVAYVMDLIGRR